MTTASFRVPRKEHHLPAKPTILYVSDLAYPAAGRRYAEEDIALCEELREELAIAMCHPREAARLMGGFDAVVVRNSGPVLHYQAAYDEFRARALATGARVYNSLDGKGDMAGKQYLLDLTAAGHPVIPTIGAAADLHRLPDTGEYVVKPKRGADSIGLRIVGRGDVEAAATGDVLIQPRIDFRYEVSFYFVDRAFEYALYAPAPDRRWDLARYEPTAADLEFAHRFIEWNELDHGIQRVDACRTQAADLLLVELEDLNPFLSLDLVDAATRAVFVRDWLASIRALLAG